MTRPKIGTLVKVIAYRPVKYAPGYRDELGTEKLFKSLVGRRLKVMGFDKHGNIKLRPTPRDTIWIERDLVEPVRKNKPSAFRREGVGSIKGRG